MTFSKSRQSHISLKASDGDHHSSSPSPMIRLKSPPMAQTSHGQISEPSTPTPTRETNCGSAKNVAFCDPPIQEPTKIASVGNPIKPILKRSIPETSTSPASREPTSVLSDIYSCSIDLTRYQNLDDVFEVAVDALHRNVKGKHLEIYAALMTLLRAKEKSVSTNSLIAHGHKLLVFAHRDLEMAETSNNKLDIRIMIQILKLVDYLLYCEDIAVTLNQELATKFLQKGLLALENPSSPKSIIAAYLHLFNYQRLPKSLSDDMATRLLLAVSSRPTLSSVGLLSEYLSTLKMLIQSHSSIMASHCSNWIFLALKSLVDSSSLVRQQALSVLQECNQKLMPNEQVSNTIKQAFAQELEGSISISAEQNDIEKVSEGVNKAHHPDVDAENEIELSPRNTPVSLKEKKCFMNVFQQRMCSLLSVSGEGKTVMSIWSAVLTAVSKSGAETNQKAEKWEYFPDMLAISKVAFNSDIPSSKLAAIQSWKVVISICSEVSGNQPDLSERKAAFLLHPLLSLLPDTRVPVVKHVIVSYIYLVNSYMQAAGPNNVTALCFIWKNLAVPFLSVYIRSSHVNNDKGAELLTQLLVGSVSTKSSPAFKDKHAESIADVSNLQSFPPKFLKTQLPLVLDFLGSLPQRVSWSDFEKVWNTILTSIRASMKREIHITRESMNQVAALCSFIAALPCQNISMHRIAAITSTLIDKLGMVPLLDRKLSVTDGALIVSGANDKKVRSDPSASTPLVVLCRSILSGHFDSDAELLESLEDFIGMLLDKTSPPKKTMAVFASFLSEIPSDQSATLVHSYSTIAKILRRQTLTWNFDSLEAEFIRVLVESFKGPIVDDHLDDWIDISSLLIKSASQFTSLLDQLVLKSDATLLAKYIIALEQRERLCGGKNIFSQNAVPITRAVGIIGSSLNNMDCAVEFVDTMINLLASDGAMSSESKAVLSHGLRKIVATALEKPNSDFFQSVKKLYAILFDYHTSSMIEDISILLMSCSEMLTAGFMSEDPEVQAISIDKWHTVFVNAKGIKGPYTKSLVAAINHCRSARGHPKVRCPVDFPVTSGRGRSTRSRGSKVLDSVACIDDVVFESVSQGSNISLDSHSIPSTPVSFGNIEKMNSVITYYENSSPVPKPANNVSEVQMEDTQDDEKLSKNEAVLSSISLDEDSAEMTNTTADEYDVPSSPPEKPHSTKISTSVSPSPSKSPEARDHSLEFSSSPPVPIKKKEHYISANDFLARHASDLSPSKIGPNPVLKLSRKRSDTSDINLRQPKRKRSLEVEHEITTLQNTPPKISQKDADSGPSTPIRTASIKGAPMTPEFSSPSRASSTSTGRYLFDILKKFENDFHSGDAFADLTAQEKFEAETLLMGVLLKARCSQMANLPASSREN